MQNTSRQWGIDLFRIISTYGIVVIHSAGYAPPIDNFSQELPEFFRFALPFFLAASFYLLSNNKKEDQLFNLISSRWNRLIIPYIIWSLIYLTFRVIKTLITSKNDDLINLFIDPFSIIFLGSSALQLYFLPLLFIGNIFSIAIRKVKTNFKISFISFCISLIIYNLILQYYANFSMKWVKFYDVFYFLQSSNLPLLSKFLFIQSWFVIICLPYIFFARMIATYPYKHNKFYNQIQTYYYLVLIFCFSWVIIFGSKLLPMFINEPIFGCLLLLIALNFPFPSSGFLDKKMLLNLTNASFGIYLIHHLVINCLQFLISKFYPKFMSQVSIPSLLFFSVSGFLISWVIVNILNKRIKIRYLFG